MTRILNDWKPETRSLLKSLVDAGFALETGDNGEDEFRFCGRVGEFIDNLIACDEARLFVTAPDGKKLWLSLVLGNEPGVIVSDYSVHPLLDKVTDEHHSTWNGRKQPTREEVI